MNGHDDMPFSWDTWSVFDHIHDAVSLVEYKNGCFHFVRNNKAHQRLSGIIHIRGLTPEELVGEEIGRTLTGYYRQCVETGRTVSYEQGFPFAPGNRIWQTIVTPVFVADKVQYLLCSSKDISELESYRNELIREKEMLQTTLRSIGDGVVTTDTAGFITSLNSMAEKITGWDSGSAVGRLFSDVFMLRNEETGLPAENPIEKVLETGLIVGMANHTVLQNRQGRTIPIMDSAAPIKTEDGQVFGVVMVFRDVSFEKEHRSQIRFLNHHDALTGLHNRRYIEEILNSIDSPENLPLAVIVCDVNGLKITNDVFGHEAGDSLLRHVADLLEKTCRKGDLIARWGGDEFVIIMLRTSLGEAEKTIKKIRLNQAAIDVSGLRLSLSYGCSVKEGGEKDLHAVLREAEEDMYHQKLLDGKSYRNAIINTLLATLYEKSMETEEHSKRLEENCHSIGRRLQLSSREMNNLSLLTVLHDIGKVAINSDILKKPAPLTPAEWEEMRRHPEIGYRIVQATPELSRVANLILSHHERWDGKGYPRKLAGKQIPLLCRILAVTDAYDAMTNDRSYRKAMSSQAAVLELKRNAGSQFDPEIVEIFIQILAESSIFPIDRTGEMA
ncbi:MAG: HD domain-containing phosphohydrolase [Clostridiales bacterium]